jgi:ribosomal protein L29
MKFKELKGISEEEKISKIEELRKEMMKLRAQSSTGSPEKTGGIRKLRKEIGKLIKSRKGVSY